MLFLYFGEGEKRTNIIISLMKKGLSKYFYLTKKLKIASSSSSPLIYAQSMTSVKSLIESAHTQLSATVKAANGTLLSTHVYSISKNLTDVLNAVRDESSNQENNFIPFLRYLNDLVPLLTDKRFFNSYEFRLSQIFVNGMKNFGKNEIIHAHILKYMSKLCENDDFIKHFLKNNGPTSIKEILKMYDTKSCIIPLALFTIYRIGHKKIDNIKSFIDDFGISLVTKILLETQHEMTIRYAIEVLILFTKYRPVMNNIPKKFAIYLVKFANKYPDKYCNLITRGIISIIDTIKGKSDAKTFVVGTDLIKIIERLCTNKEEYVNYVFIFYFLHMAEVQINIIGKEHIFLDSFMSGKCLGKTGQFCFVNIRQEPNTLKTIIEKREKTFYELLHTSINPEIIIKLVSLLFDSDEEFLRSDKLDYKELSSILNEKMGLIISKKDMAEKLFSDKILNNTKIVFDIKNIMKILASMSIDDGNNVFRALHYSVIQNALEKNINNAIGDFILGNGINISLNINSCLNKGQKDCIIKKVVNCLKSVSKNPESNIKSLIKYIDENNISCISIGVKEKIPGVFSLIRFMIKQKNENIIIGGVSALSIVLKEMEESMPDQNVLAECCKIIKALINIVPINTDLVQKIRSLYFSFQSKGYPFCNKLQEALDCMNKLKRPYSLLTCKSITEALDLMKDISIKNTSDLDTFITYLSDKNDDSLNSNFMKVLEKNKDVFFIYDENIKYSFIIDRLMQHIKNKDGEENASELLKHIFKASLNSPENQYFSRLCDIIYLNNAYMDTLRGSKFVEEVLTLVTHKEVFERFKQVELSNDEKKGFFELLTKKSKLLKFFDPEKLVGFILSVMKELSKELDVQKVSLSLCRVIIESSSNGMFNIPSSDLVLNVLINNADDMRIQEDAIKIISCSSNLNNFIKPKFAVHIKTLMEVYRENISIQECVSVILYRVRNEIGKKDKEWKKSDLVYSVIDTLGLNPYNVIINKNLVEFLCDKDCLDFIRQENKTSFHHLKIIIDFLKKDNAGDNDLKEKVVLFLYTMLKNKVGELKNDELWADILSCAKKFFFVFGNKVKARFTKIIVGDKKREETFVSDIRKLMKDDDKQLDVWRVISKYTSCAEEFNMSKRCKEIEEVHRSLELYDKQDGGKPGFETLVQFMKDERGCQRNATKLLTIIKSFANDHNELHKSLKCLKRVKKIMVLFYNNKEIQCVGCEILSVYAGLSHYKPTIIGKYYKELLFENFKRFNTDINIQKNILNIISNVITLNAFHGDFLEPGNISEFKNLTKHIKERSEDDEVRKQVASDSVHILEDSAAKNKFDKIDKSVVDDVLECLRDIYGLNVYDDNLAILRAITSISGKSDFHYNLIRGGWLEIIMKDYRKESTPQTITGIVEILCNLLKEGYKPDDDDKNENKNDDIELFSQDENDVTNKSKFVKDEIKKFVDNINLKEFGEIMSFTILIDLKKLYSKANTLLGYLLMYPSVKERIGDFVWLYFTVKFMDAIFEKKKSEQRKDLSKTCSIIWSLAIDVMDKNKLPVVDNVFAFIESSLIMAELKIHESSIPALSAILAHENALVEVPKNLKQRVRKVREDHKDSKIIRVYSDAILGIDNKKVKCAIEGGVCTRTTVPDCDGDCQGKQGFYCEKCCVVQKLFRCNTCNDKKMYCEHCIGAYHKGHETEQLAMVGVCQSEKGVEDGIAKRESVQKALEDLESDIKKKGSPDISKTKNMSTARKKAIKSQQMKIDYDEEKGDDDDVPKEPAKKKVKVTQGENEEEEEEEEGEKKEVIDSGCVLSRLLDEVVSSNTSTSNEKIIAQCSKIAISNTSLKSALEKAKIKGVDEICRLCTENSNRAYDNYAYEQDMPRNLAEAICSLQLSLSSVRKASQENEHTPCEILSKALLDRQRHNIDEVESLLALVLSGLSRLRKKRFPVLFRAIPLSSPLLKYFADTNNMFDANFSSTGAERRRRSFHSPGFDNGDQRLFPLLTFASTEMSTITEIVGTNLDKYAIVIFVGDVWGYDITEFSCDKGDCLNVVLDPESQTKVVDIAKSGKSFTAVTVSVSCPMIIKKKEED